jgi:geranylgeranyl pyrophosphate synthase
LTLIEERNGVARTRERANSFIEKARAIIAEFPDSPYRRALAAVADLVTERDR